METQQNFGQNAHEGGKFSIGFFFLNLGVLIALITSVVAFLNLVFETLNKRFPDVLNASYSYGYSTYQYEGIRMALATLIIFFPVFIIVSYFWKKMAERGVGSIDQFIKKLVVYIILFLSSLVVVIDLVTLVRYFISGEITSRFIYKVLAALIVAGLVGAYYILLLRKKGVKTGMIFGGVGILLVLVAICYSFSVMGSPAKQRMLRLDDRRVGDMQNIQYQVINFWQQKEKLPKDLAELNNPINGTTVPVPPEFEKGEVYEYKNLGAMKFELCATFAAEMPKGWQEYGGMYYGYGGIGMRDVAVAPSMPYPGGVNDSWDHQAGRTCFERTIDPDVYPPYPKPLR